jgi:hypothetical protein
LVVGFGLLAGRRVTMCHNLTQQPQRPDLAPSFVMCTRKCKRPSGIVCSILNSLSARAVCARFPRCRRQLWGGPFWEDGSCVRSVGDAVTAAIIRRYIRYQKSPHNVQLSWFAEGPEKPRRLRRGSLLYRREAPQTTADGSQGTGAVQSVGQNPHATEPKKKPPAGHYDPLRLSARVDGLL